MSLNFSVQPGKIMAEGELVTNAKLNQIAVPIIQAEGVIGPSDMGPGDYSALFTAADYFYAAATLSGANYTAALTPAITAYVDGLLLAVKVDAVNPAAATLDAGGGAKPLYASGGTRVPDAGEIPANTILELRYSSSLNAAAGGWQILSTLKDRTTVHPFVGASATIGGLAGLVPEPRAGDEAKVLRGSGAWESLTAEIDARIAASTALANTLPLFLNSNY